MNDNAKLTKTDLNSTIVWNGDRAVALDCEGYRVSRTTDPDAPYMIRFTNGDVIAIDSDELIERFAQYDIEYLD